MAMRVVKGPIGSLGGQCSAIGLEAIGKYWNTLDLKTVGRREFFGTIEGHGDDFSTYFF